MLQSVQALNLLHAFPLDTKMKDGCEWKLCYIYPNLLLLYCTQIQYKCLPAASCCNITKFTCFTHRTCVACTVSHSTDICVYTSCLCVPSSILAVSKEATNSTSLWQHQYPVILYLTTSGIITIVCVLLSGTCCLWCPLPDCMLTLAVSSTQLRTAPPPPSPVLYTQHLYLSGDHLQRYNSTS